MKFSNTPTAPLHTIALLLCLLGGYVYGEPQDGLASRNNNPAENYLKQQRAQEKLKQIERKQSNYSTQPKAAIPQDEQCFAVEHIDVTGSKLISESELEDIVGAYRKRCLGKNGINQLMQTLTARYVSQGYITSRVYIPAQDLRSGTLKLVVVEGEVESVSINNNSSADRRKLWWAMPLRWGDHLSLNDIEQGLDQLNRVPSASATMKLWPGQTTGASHIQILHKTDDEYRGHIAIDNATQYGRLMKNMRLSASADNLIGINDSSTVTLITSKNSNALSFNTSFPFRRWRFDASHSYSEYLTVLPGPSDLFGRSYTTTLQAQYLVVRRGPRQLNAQMSLARRRSERALLGVDLSPQQLIPLRGALNYTQNAPWGYLTAELGWVRGLSILNATQDPDNLPKGAPQAQFDKVDANVTVVLPLSASLSWQSIIAGQYSKDGLYSSEQINLGGSDSVHGVPSAIISGDQGFYWRNTLNITPVRFWSQPTHAWRWLRHTKPALFLDHGQAKLTTESKYLAMSGMGMGLGVHYKRLSIDSYWARLLDSTTKVTKRNAFYFSAKLTLF